ncbi:MAG: lantibiotic dehydratase [Chitinophaga sp.]|uniref:lantibiotic dehydratase n=1 Tax=Chitinophaga sp. TaxID=1869181 RepID=UPI0025BC8E2B|nr:lantibiotic dehydratase [Chitinophaga sp.]MBV8253008.1 lantibiotic dehydratase [Chitinophaga sp.]
MALTHTGLFLLRSPLYPLNFYTAVLEKTLPELATEYPEFLYALHIASGELLKELDRYLAEPTAFQEKKLEKLRKAMYKYWVRACTRSTPYGLFAGCTTGTVADSTSWTIDQQGSRQHVRLDMDYFTKITHHIQELPTVKQQLRYFPNNSIYKSGQKYRYAEYSIVHNRRKYLLTAVTTSAFLDQILVQSATGSTIAQLVDVIRAIDPSIDPNDAQDFVSELIQSQLLIAETEPRITETDNLRKLTARLLSIEDLHTLRETLMLLSNLFQQQDFDRNRLRQIEETCTTNFPLEMPKDLLQVDLFRNGNCTISEQLMNNILTQVQELSALCLGYGKSPSSDLNGFMDRFRERYEAAEVPLNLVLDSEAGIGYGIATGNVHTPFVEDIDTAGSAMQTTVIWSAMQQLCLEKYEQFLRTGGSVEVTGADLKSMGDPAQVNMAASCYMFGMLYAASGAAADNGDYRFALQSVGGPSAANLVGRFCSGDPELGIKMKAILDQEAATIPDAIFAEVIHFPEARAANVLIRPVLRDYEIPYIGISGVPEAQQIPVSDLMVAVKGNEVILRSKRLNKRIIPRLSSAHNYSNNSLPIYKFLCDLQHQSQVSHISWDWGILANRPHLPRVTYKQLIVCREAWMILKKEIEQVPDTVADRQQFISTYMQQHQLPEQVLMVEADNELLLDLRQAMVVDMLFDQIKKAGHVRLKEFIHDANAGMLRDTNGNVYAHEMLVPVVFTPAKAPQAAMVQAPTEIPLERNFAPGGEWLYLKIYCGYRIAEELLSGYFAEHIPQWQEDGLFEQCFFLRYADPQPHIRIRFLNKAHPAANDYLLHQIEQALQPYIAAGQVQKIVCDTYIREIERYGDTILASEAIFHRDSLAVLEIISMLEGAEGEVYRWKLALRGMDMLLNDFGFDLGNKRKLLGVMRAQFIEEFGGGNLLNKPLNDKYRKHQQEIMSFMNPADDEQNDIVEAIACYTARSIGTVDAVAQIRERWNGTEKYGSVIASHIHMFINRLFVGKQRKHELILYHFLEKYYISQLAMEAASK